MGTNVWNSIFDLLFHVVGWIWLEEPCLFLYLTKKKDILIYNKPNVLEKMWGKKSKPPPYILGLAQDINNSIIIYYNILGKYLEN